MFREVFKNKESGKQELFWGYWENGSIHYFNDITLTTEVDIDDYDKQDVEGNIVNIPTPYQLFGVECERGWYQLLKPIIDYIDDYNKDKDESNMIYIIQIKEKLGTLRFYVSYCTPELNKLINDAEDESANVCEICGSREHVGTTLGWYITICHDCLKKMCKDREETVKWCNYDDDKVYWVSPDKEDEFVESIEDYNNSML